MTESGKTVLSKNLAKTLASKGKTVFVYDPVGVPSEWGNAKVFDDADKFSVALKKSKSVHAFVDEAGTLFDEGNATEYNWLATRSRHWGHSVYFISQRLVQIPKTVRDQCNRLYLFTSSSKDGIGHAEEWNKPILTQCNRLPKLTFFSVDRYSEAKVYRIENFSKIRPVRWRTGKKGETIDSDNPTEV
jgi:hypothetical protein